jgi:hypothetical protein
MFDAYSVGRILVIDTYGFTIGGEAVLFVIFDDKIMNFQTDPLHLVKPASIAGVHLVVL